MSIKGVLQSNRVQVNKFELMIVPLTFPKPLFTRISGLEMELDTVDLPDRTTRSGGREKQVEFEVDQPMHHVIEVVAMEGWWKQCVNTLPLYLKIGTLLILNEYLGRSQKFMLYNLWLSKRSQSDLDLDNDGDMAIITWTMKADSFYMVPG